MIEGKTEREATYRNALTVVVERDPVGQGQDGVQEHVDGQLPPDELVDGAPPFEQQLQKCADAAAGNGLRNNN
jgi:hypothetical protein